MTTKNAVKPALGTVYGIEAETSEFLSTTKRMTVADLIRELQAFPLNAVPLISVDEEGNWFKSLANLNGGKFGIPEDHEEGATHLMDGDPDQLTDRCYSGSGLKQSDPYVIIWPHG